MTPLTDKQVAELSNQQIEDKSITYEKFSALSEEQREYMLYTVFSAATENGVAKCRQEYLNIHNNLK